MIIETNEAYYELDFNTVQVEVTGKCNLKCSHCRASYDPSDHVTLDLVEKLFKFANLKQGFNFTVSGGEPFLYPDLIKLLSFVKSKSPNEVVITTNGYHIKDHIIAEIQKLEFRKITFQISIDSSNEMIHNNFRGNSRSYEKALYNIEKLSSMGMFTSVRATLTPDTQNEMEDIIKLVINKGAKRVSFGTVVPSGSAVANEKLLVSSNQKKQHIDNLIYLKEKYKLVAEIVTEDPLKSLPENSQWHHLDDNIRHLDGYIAGCDAGITQLNMYSNGDITPCALLNKVIVNLSKNSVESARLAYSESKVIKGLIEKKFEGKCADCKKIKLCGGGCRAIPFGINRNYLGSDPTCFNSLL